MAIEDPQQSSTEEALVDRFRSTGDNQYFELLYRAARRKVFGVCFKFLREAESAEDATHEAFLRAFERFHTMEGSNFSAWVCRIAANLCINRIRDQRTREQLLTAAPQPRRDPEHPQERQTIQAEEKQMVLEVIESLASEQRKVLLLRHMDDCSYQEIEQITGYNSAQVRSYLQNARRNFQLRWRSKIGANVDDA
jgi:RNA polymerase sigma-70 factor (ECF subfamily)